ncbi:ABC transporter substrate-binding protein [Shigella sonnei]
MRIPYYRPLDRYDRAFCRPCEQHLAGQIFSGLTRFDNDTQRPIGDLAHHWETSTDGLRWDFYLRLNLHWHNGDAVKATHLHQRLLMLLQLPALDQLFISVKRIEVTHPAVSDLLFTSPRLLACAPLGELLQPSGASAIPTESARVLFA